MNDAMRDPFLELELDGLRLIEASAGTGKTFTLATLVTRLVIERGLRVGQILAVTFTEAATQELRERLRQRLVLAARIAADDPGVEAGSDAGAVAITRTLIQARLQHEDTSSLRRRLQRAAREIDLAAVFTIHGFCARVLSEHALETSQPFIAPEMIGSDRELRAEVAADLWRSLGTDPVSAELLQAHWSAGPEALANDLAALLHAPRLLPPPAVDAPDPLPTLQLAAAALRAAFVQHGDNTRERLDTALAAGVIDGRKARKPSYEKAWHSLADGMAIGEWSRESGSHLDKLTPQRLRECAKAGRENELPESPLFAAVADWFAAATARDEWLDARGIALLHRVRAEAAIRMANLKRVRRVQTYDDLIDGVHTALDGEHGAALAAQLRAQYAVALVDEFQDTDPRQWAIFARVFGPRPDMAGSLFLIGDPKQAIYRFRGGDVHTYLAAADQAAAAPPLVHNFRSRPALLRALAALYARAGADAFVDTRIRFLDVHAGGSVADGDYLRHGQHAPALTVRVLPPPGDGRKAAHWSSPESRALATHACVAAIHEVLSDARGGHANVDGHPVQPGDIAVLVRMHAEAAQMQAALIAAGIPAVAAGRQSLFATEQAMELLALFDALLQPGDDRRLRAAVATVLIGLDGAAIARFDQDEAWQRDWQLRAMGWRERWQRHGPLALVTDLCAHHAPRLLALLDGERRLTNLLQLAEALQEADARALGVQGLVDWLRVCITDADAFDETQQLRLESDARRVQIVTLHKSKGLEFPLVFLPFVGIGKEAKHGHYCEYQAADPGSEGGEASGRVLQLKTDRVAAGALSWDDARARAAIEERGEDARLLYVGLTRAQHALWLATGPLYAAGLTPLAAMLGEAATLRTVTDGDVQIDDSGLPPSRLAPLSPAPTGVLPPTRDAGRVLSRDWWVYSFTQLTNAASGADTAVETMRNDGIERGADDEPEALSAVVELGEGVRDLRFSGSRFGNVLHTALEHVDFAAWREWRDGPPPSGQDAPLRAALRGEGYADADIEDGVAVLAALVGHTLTVRLPEGVCLCDVPENARRVEMEFHFAMRPTSVEAVLATLHAHGVLRDRHAFGARRMLEGLMTGKIDLVYMHNEGMHTNGMHAGGDQPGRYYLLDYKSNRLPAYDEASLDQAMADGEYTLQALIYTLALHRWLRFRLGDAYEYERDFGGVRYLFCRGLDAANGAAPGVYARQPPSALVVALDALFATPGTDA
jgi:exodeoxyribonuclease V beta subunit